MGKERSSRTGKLDQFDLYQRSLQIEDGAAFLAQSFKLTTGRPLRFLREDFCGTAFNCCQFVKLHPKNRAIGVDLDESALKWCLHHNYLHLKESQWERITLIKGNVLHVQTPKVEMIAALNHSYSIFKKRTDLLAYFVNSRKNLVSGGVMLLDNMGGADFLSGDLRKTRKQGLVYTSEISPVDPITHDFTVKVSFASKNRPPLRNAFVYNYRLWSLPELQELLMEAGFRNIHVLWEFRLPKGSSIFRRADHGSSYAFQDWYAIVIGQA